MAPSFIIVVGKQSCWIIRCLENEVVKATHPSSPTAPDAITIANPSARDPARQSCALRLHDIMIYLAPRRHPLEGRIINEPATCIHPMSYPLAPQDRQKVRHLRRVALRSNRLDARLKPSSHVPLIFGPSLYISYYRRCPCQSPMH